MTGDEPAQFSDDEVPYSRWEDFKRRLLTTWREDHFGRHTFYWSVIVFCGVMLYELVLRFAAELGFLG